jgi:hypothetical protein
MTSKYKMTDDEVPMRRRSELGVTDYASTMKFTGKFTIKNFFSDAFLQIFTSHQHGFKNQ